MPWIPCAYFLWILQNLWLLVLQPCGVRCYPVVSVWRDAFEPNIMWWCTIGLAHPGIPFHFHPMFRPCYSTCVLACALKPDLFGGRSVAGNSHSWKWACRLHGVLARRHCTAELLIVSLLVIHSAGVLGDSYTRHNRASCHTCRNVLFWYFNSPETCAEDMSLLRSVARRHPS